MDEIDGWGGDCEDSNLISCSLGRSNRGTVNSNFMQLARRSLIGQPLRSTCEIVSTRPHTARAEQVRPHNIDIEEKWG
jgi:hypothetical protein